MRVEFTSSSSIYCFVERRRRKEEEEEEEVERGSKCGQRRRARMSQIDAAPPSSRWGGMASWMSRRQGSRPFHHHARYQVLVRGGHGVVVLAASPFGWVAKIGEQEDVAGEASAVCMLRLRKLLASLHLQTSQLSQLPIWRTAQHRSRHQPCLPLGEPRSRASSPRPNAHCAPPRVSGPRP